MWHRGLRIWHCHCSILGGCCSSGSVLWPGNFHMLWVQPKKKKNHFHPQITSVYTFLIIYLRSSRYRAMGSALSLQHWDTTLIPSLAQQVKDPALPHCDVDCNCSIGCKCCLDLIPGLGNPYAMGFHQQTNKLLSCFFCIRIQMCSIHC